MEQREQRKRKLQELHERDVSFRRDRICKVWIADSVRDLPDNYIDFVELDVPAADDVPAAEGAAGRSDKIWDKLVMQNLGQVGDAKLGTTLATHRSKRTILKVHFASHKLLVDIPKQAAMRKLMDKVCWFKGIKLEEMQFIGKDGQCISPDDTCDSLGLKHEDVILVKRIPCSDCRISRSRIEFELQSRRSSE